MINVRRAYELECEWLYQECVEFAKKYPSRYNLAGNKEYALEFLKNLVSNHLVLIAESEAERLGFIAGLVSNHHFNPDIKTLIEMLWWVRPEHREKGAGALLFKEFINFGKENCDLITMTLEKESQVPDNYLEKHGFRLTEKAYLMECD